MKQKISDLENIKTSLGRQVDQLTNDKMETEQDYKTKVCIMFIILLLPTAMALMLQLAVKNTEIEAIRLDLEQERHKYEDILTIKQAMDAEIAIYKALLDGEEKRVSRYEQILSVKHFIVPVKKGPN